MKKYVVVGGGNIGSLLLAELVKHNENSECILITKSSEKWCNELSVVDGSGAGLYSVNSFTVTRDFVDDGDVYFFTLPKNILFDELPLYCERVKSGAKFVFVPGTGGIEFFSTRDDIEFIGLQRVPFISRVQSYGKSVCMLSKKDEIFVSSMKGNDVQFLSGLLDINVVEINNFLEITFTPSNPILHTSRLFAMFSKNVNDFPYKRMILFYEEWCDFSSEMLIECDRELHNIIDVINQFMPIYVKPLTDHYESHTITNMTNKISHINAFKGITSPMVEIDNNYYIDKSSRYFSEDFNYGLLIIKAFADICCINTPYINRIIKWYGKLMDKEILKDNKLIIREGSITPQNFGINCIDDICRFYNKKSN